MGIIFYSIAVLSLGSDLMLISPSSESASQSERPNHSFSLISPEPSRTITPATTYTYTSPKKRSIFRSYRSSCKS